MGEPVFLRYTGRPHTMLYKYFGNLTYAKKTIENSCIHLEEPSTYNDIYDSSIRMTGNDLLTHPISFQEISQKFRTLPGGKYTETLNEIERSRANTSSSVYTAGEFVRTMCCINPDLDKGELEKDCMQLLGLSGILQEDGVKISCFSERWDSLLMWAYYAKSYSGVCLGFDTSVDSHLWKNCQKVQYSNHFLPNIGCWDNFFRKSEEWAHEQEWRAAMVTSEEFLPVNRPSCIILGIRMSKNAKNSMVKLARRYDMEVYELFQSDSEYKLERRLLEEVNPRIEKLRNSVGNPDNYIIPAKK